MAQDQSDLLDQLETEAAQVRAELAALSYDSRRRVRLLGRRDGLQRAITLVREADATRPERSAEHAAASLQAMKAAPCEAGL